MALAMVGQPEGVVIAVGQFRTPQTSASAFDPSPVLKNASATVQIYHYLYFKTVFQVGVEVRQKQDAMWTQRIRDELGREWMLFCFDVFENGVTYVRFNLDCLSTGPKAATLDQLKDTKVCFKLLQASNQNELRTDEQLANENIEDGNPKVTLTHNFARDRKLDSGNLFRKDEIPMRFHGTAIALMVTITCKVGEDHVEFNDFGGVKNISRYNWP